MTDVTDSDREVARVAVVNAFAAEEIGHADRKRILAVGAECHAAGRRAERARLREIGGELAHAHEQRDTLASRLREAEALLAECCEAMRQDEDGELPWCIECRHPLVEQNEHCEFHRARRFLNGGDHGK